jgi:hypothetical protein
MAVICSHPVCGGLSRDDVAAHVTLMCFSQQHQFDPQFSDLCVKDIPKRAVFKPPDYFGIERALVAFRSSLEFTMKWL